MVRESEGRAAPAASAAARDARRARRGPPSFPLPDRIDSFSVDPVWVAWIGPWRETMMRGDAKALRLALRLQAAAAIGLALAIFALDVLTPLQGAVAVLYTTAILVAARANDRDLIITAGIVCALLAVLGYAISHSGEPLGSPAMRLTVSLAAIGITTVLSVRHRAATDQSRRSEQRYRTIFDAAGFPIWETDWSATYALLQAGRPPEDMADHTVRHAVIRDVNQATVQMFGVAGREALVGGTVLAYRTPAGQAALERIVRGLFSGKSTIREEAQFRTVSGEVVDVILRVTLPVDHDGWKRVLVMALDVTERNRTQARLDQSQAELAHVSRVSLLGQLAASIAHEVNQPLSAIITYAKSGRRWLAREAPDAREVADCLDHIASNGTRAADVIAHIRDLARKTDPKQAGFDLAPLIHETIALLRRDLQSHEVAITASIAPGLPAVAGDRVQIQQVLMNLMLNADQAMAQTPPGKRELSVDAMGDGQDVIVEVRDRGSGITVDPETLFSPFFTTKADGMGMGLAICRSIIERHGGKLTSANRPDGGAAFRFSLPMPAPEGGTTP